MSLTDKQEMFVKEYLVDLNATQAAIRAGYSKKTARKIGQENLTKPDIQAAIQKAMNERSKRVEITADRVLQELAHIAFDDIRNYLSFRTEKQLVGYDPDGEDGPEPVYDYRQIIDIKDSETIDTRNVAEVSMSPKDGFKFKMYCKDHALVNLGKHLGMFKDGNNMNVNFGVQIIDDIGGESDGSDTD